MSKFVFLPFCLFPGGEGGVKIVYGLISGGLRLSKFAFFPGGVKIVSGLISGGLTLSKFAFLPFCLFPGGRVKIVSGLISGGLTLSKFAFLPFSRGGKNSIWSHIWRSQIE